MDQQTSSLALWRKYKRYAFSALATLVLAEQTVIGLGPYISSRYQIQHPALVHVFDPNTEIVHIGFGLNTEPKVNFAETSSGLEVICSDGDTIVALQWSIYKKPGNTDQPFAEAINLVGRQSLSVPLHWLAKGNYQFTFFYIDGKNYVQSGTKEFSVDKNYPLFSQQRGNI